MQAIITERTNAEYVHTGIRGRGLAKIVAEWTDELEFSDRPEGGIKVRIKKFLKSPELQEMAGALESPTHLVLEQ